MKRIVTSVGVVALGAAFIQTSQAQTLGVDASKPWTISAALRGFYDDNVNTGSRGSEVDTFGFEISPSIGINLPLDQTTLSLTYTYAYKYYDKRPSAANGQHDDQTHTIAASMLHNFSERTSLTVRDSFVIGQEPDVNPNGVGNVTLQRISGDNIRNYGSIAVNHQISPLVGVEVGYQNSLFDYDDELGNRTPPLTPAGAIITAIGGFPLGVYPIGAVTTSSGLLDRIEHSIHLDTRWTISETTVGIVGYQFSLGEYTGNEPIGVLSDGVNIANNRVVTSGVRDYHAHYGYVGLEHTFRPDLTGSIRGGVRYSDYYNTPDKETAVSPYAMASLRYTYASGCYLDLGVSHDRSASESFSVQGPSVTTDVELTAVNLSLTHTITPDLTGSLSGSFQNDTYNGGSLNDRTEQYYTFGAGLAYQVSRHVSTTLSYNFDHVESDQAGRSYDRNRVFLGAVVTY